MDRFESIFEALNARGARYVVVGGVAVNLQGYQRLTKDLDLVVELTPDNALRALQALSRLDFHPRVPVRLEDFANSDVRETWIREKNMIVFQMYHDARRITVDIFVRHPIDFDELWDQASEFSLGRTRVRVASIAHIIQMKRAAGRPQDLVDIAKLERVVALTPKDKIQ